MSRRRRSACITQHPRKRTKTVTTPMHAPSNKPSLLTLPDEPLTQIISLLSTPTPSLHAPSAFFLAQTNTRFLNIFRSLLTRITPYISNPTIPTLSCTHLAAVSRLAGEHLRAVHVPEGALFCDLADDCPGVQELSFRDDGRSECTLEYLVDKLPLKVVEVHRPYSETLAMLDIKLEKLVLKEVCTSDIYPLLAILRNPPKEIDLGIDYLGSNRLERVFTALEEAIEKIEKLTASVPSSFTPQRFEEDVRDRVKKLRESGRESKCKVVSLSGVYAFRLLQFVDCSARVTLRCGSSEYRNDAPGEECYATKLGLQHDCPRGDLSRLEEVSFTTDHYEEWVDRLPPLRRVNVFHEGLLPPVHTEVLMVPVPSEPYEEWNFPTRELWFMGEHLGKLEVLNFCGLIAQILARFNGKVVWMEHVKGYDLPEEKDELRRSVRCAKYACECFQEQGGDAGSVLAWLDDVFAKCF